MIQQADRLYNCPNCGAPIGYSDVCAYCGTRLNWVPFQFDVLIRPKHLKLEKAEAVAFVGDEIPQEHHGPIVRDGMAGQLAKHIVNNMRLKKERDWRRNGWQYKAQIMFADMNDGEVQE